ncbi:multidrug resistance-associated protein 4-like [Stylophora pistillata]|uniref:multidrug resistance-associated protein 4-like n=1 Tax=Stylophora pistillata TaxID=50429 RepID=UPI000C05256F|nr:multidrug resistance-associated protein 4-like [Stylophora pistillata]
MALVATLGWNQKGYRCELFGIRISSALRGMVYCKSLLLSKESLQKVTTGRVFDLISNDVKRIENLTFVYFFGFPFNFIENVVMVLLLHYWIGWQAITGAMFLFLLVPYFAGLSYASAAVRLRTAAVSDRRISLMNQVVATIRAIKAHVWGDEYRGRIQDIRRDEINTVHEKNVLHSTVDGLIFSASTMTTLVSILAMLLTGQTITPVNVFMLLSYVGILRRNTCNEMAHAFLVTHDTYVSLGRIENFLLLDELSRNFEDEPEKNRYSPDISSVKRQKNADHVLPAYEIKDSYTSSSLRVSNLTYKGTDREHEFILQDIDFVAPSESLTVIAGPVGSGKSTLLSAIAGEISVTRGKITKEGTIIHLPQTAWVFSGTLRENILFGQPYEESKYAVTIDACALQKDIQRFPKGDLTVVGERGELLSGGQQARVSLARAVYADGDIYLLDNPLCAVDSKVGQHIFEKCIKDLLCNKTRILTSHQEQHIKDADEVIVLDKGRVLGKGRCTDLQGKGIIISTINPVYKASLHEITDLMESFGWNKDEILEDGDECSKLASQPCEGKSLNITEEDRAVGVVTFKLYWEYLRSGLHPLVIIAVLCFCIIAQAVIVAPDLWLPFFIKQTLEEQRNKTNLIIYGILVAGCFIFAIARAYGLLLVFLKCAKRLHDKMVVAILHAPVLFFDSNPAGRILNRFSNDIDCVDEHLPREFLLALEYFLLMCTAVFIPIAANPWLLFVIIPLTGLYVYISKYYLKTSQELKRLESICRSPVFSHFSETIKGLSTIRTRGRQSDFMDTFYRHQDVHNQSCVFMRACGRWLAVRLDVLAVLLVGAVALGAVLTAQNAAFAGLSFVYAIQSITLLQYFLRTSSDVENYMTSVERVITYTKLDSEPGYKVERLPPENWPMEGSLTFRDVQGSHLSWQL